MYRTFTGHGTPEDAKIVIETIAEICKINDRCRVTGLDGVVELAIREGMRRAYLDITECIHVGAREREDAVWSVVGDSEHDEE